jgi:hypothetical protein
LTGGGERARSVVVGPPRPRRGAWRAVVLGVTALAGVTLLASCEALSGLRDLAPVDCVDVCDEGGAPVSSAQSLRLSGAGDDSAVSPCAPRSPTSGCGACGVACDTATSTRATCVNGACVYTCAPGHIDCHTAPPNGDGCECETPACCGDVCQSTHSNGLGQTFYDCTPPQTYTRDQATAACAAYTGNSSDCGDFACPEGGERAVCALSLTSCACWTYTGAHAGRVLNTGNLPHCVCAGDTAPTWD